MMRKQGKTLQPIIMRLIKDLLLEGPLPGYSYEPNSPFSISDGGHLLFENFILQGGVSGKNIWK